MARRVSPVLVEALTPREPKLSRQEVSRWLHAMARDLGWSLGDLHWDEYPKSFHWIAGSERGRQFALLIGREVPVVALSETLPDYWNLRFVDDPRLNEATRTAHAPFEILAAADLAAPLTAEDRAFAASCSPQHARDMAYWKPRTVGDVVFNWWD